MPASLHVHTRVCLRKLDVNMEHLVNLVLFMALLASFMAGKRQNALLV